jgi:hypothetical protein
MILEERQMDRKKVMSGQARTEKGKDSTRHLGFIYFFILFTLYLWIILNNGPSIPKQAKFGIKSCPIVNFVSTLKTPS